ncbi:MAG: DUF3568 family protein [Candidatus Omnitrophota bacterium]
MMTRFLIFIAVVSIGLSGCATAVVVGGVTAASVVAVTSDYATTSIDTDFNHAWKVANAQLKKIGEVDENYQKLGEIKATVNDHDVKVTISKLTEKTIDIRVAARRNLIPNVNLARAIMANIIRNF